MRDEPEMAALDDVIECFFINLKYGGHRDAIENLRDNEECFDRALKTREPLYSYLRSALSDVLEIEDDLVAWGSSAPREQYRWNAWQRLLVRIKAVQLEIASANCVRRSDVTAYDFDRWLGGALEPTPAERADAEGVDFVD